MINTNKEGLFEPSLGEVFNFNGMNFRCLENDGKREFFICAYCDIKSKRDCDVLACSFTERSDCRECYFVIA